MEAKVALANMVNGFDITHPHFEKGSYLFFCKFDNSIHFMPRVLGEKGSQRCEWYLMDMDGFEVFEQEYSIKMRGIEFMVNKKKYIEVQELLGGNTK